MKLKDKVEHYLREYPNTRNSDRLLTIMIWEEYNPYPINNRMHLFELLKVANQETVKRFRAHIQNVEKKYIPTSEQVAKERQWNIDEWRRLLGYSPKPNVNDKVEERQEQQHLLNIRPQLDT